MVAHLKKDFRGDSMTEVNQGEGTTPPASTGEKPIEQNANSTPAGGLKDAEEAEKLKEELNKAREERNRYQEGMLKWKGKYFDAEEKAKNQPPYVPPTYSPIEPDDIDDYEKQKFAKMYQQTRETERKTEREQNIKNALNKFFIKNPEYSPEVDIEGKSYQELQQITSRIYLGQTVDEIMDSLEMAHRMRNAKSTPPPKTESVEDTGIGDTTSVPKGEPKKPDALTRPLNKWEKEAAASFPGGEIAYRKKLAEKEQAKSSI